MQTFQIDFDVNRYVVNELIDAPDPIGFLVGGYLSLERLKACPIYQKVTAGAKIVITPLAKRMMLKEGAGKR